jgi:hypothetical protein
LYIAYQYGLTYLTAGIFYGCLPTMRLARKNSARAHVNTTGEVTSTTNPQPKFLGSRPVLLPAVSAIFQTHKAPRSCCKTHTNVLSGHGFNRAKTMSPRQRLQPLRANDVPQGVKGGIKLDQRGGAKIDHC